MNRLCERAAMRRNRRFVRTGMSAAQIGKCPEVILALAARMPRGYRSDDGMVL
jgi:hypothetical protein